MGKCQAASGSVRQRQAASGSARQRQAASGYVVSHRGALYRQRQHLMACLLTAVRVCALEYVCVRSLVVHDAGRERLRVCVCGLAPRTTRERVSGVA